MGERLTAKDLELDLEEDEPLDVLDLPQIYTKPSARSLLDTLSLLSLEPRSWEGTPPLTPGANTPRSVSGATTPALRAKRKVKSEGVPQYLTKIVSSPLAWIEDDNTKEEVWEVAAMRLSERSGRTGMGAISRSFCIPLAAESINESSTLQTVIAPSQQQETALDIQIHEPALTADNLGLKTWASSYVLAKKWHVLRDRLPLPSKHTSQSQSVSILELGAGTGLVGIAAAAVLGVNVLLTDLPEIVSNLDRNASDNAEAMNAHGGSAQVAVLDWSLPENIEWPGNACTTEAPNTVTKSVDHQSCSTQRINSLRAPVIVAADPIYSEDHPDLLAQAVEYHLLRDADARVIIEMPVREGYAKERSEFQRCMRAIGLVLENEETDTGYDDWADAHGEDLQEVECWMTIWAWGDSQL